MGVGVLILLMILEGFRRQMKGVPRSIVVVIMVGGSIGYFVTIYGLRELQLGRWMGVIWILIGIGINYIVVRELWQSEVWQKRVKKEVGKPLSFWMKTLIVVLFALLVVIILVVSGGDLPLIPILCVQSVWILWEGVR